MRAFVITLDTDGARYTQFQQSVETHGGGLEVEVFEAVDASSFTADSEELDPFTKFPGLLKGQVGCTLSHIALLELCALGDQNFLIFEDDASLNLEFPNRPTFPEGADCLSYHVGNVHDAITDDLVHDGVFYLDSKHKVSFPTCAIEWSPEGARKFLSMMFKNLPLSRVKPSHQVLKDTSDSVRQQRQVRWYHHDIQQMLYAYAEIGKADIRVNAGVTLNPSVNCTIHPSVITEGDFIVPPLEEPVVEVTLEAMKRNMLVGVRAKISEGVTKGYYDPILDLKLATGSSDQQMFTSLVTTHQLRATDPEESVVIKTLEGGLTTITFAEFSALMVRYGDYSVAAWTQTETLKSAINSATSKEELQAILENVGD